MDSIIPRSRADTRIVRVVTAQNIRGDEIQSAYEQVGKFPHNNVKSWYRDIYEFYQNNEV